MSLLRGTRTIALGLACAMNLCWLRAAAASPGPNATELLQNGSFETGNSEPAGWRLYRGALWTTGSAHRGTRSISGVSKKEEKEIYGLLRSSTLPAVTWRQPTRPPESRTLTQTHPLLWHGCR